MRHIQVVGLLVLIVFGVLAHKSASERGQGSSIQLDNAWMRRTSTTGQMEQGSHGGSMMDPEESALYVTVHNHGSEPDALLSASSEVATASVLHQTMSRDSTTVMQPQAQFALHAMVAKTPGFAHERQLHG